MIKTFCDICKKEIKSTENSIEFDVKTHNGNFSSFVKESFSMIMCSDCWFKFKKYVEESR